MAGDVSLEKPAQHDASVRDCDLAEEALRCILAVVQGFCHPMTDTEKLAVIGGFAKDGLGMMCDA